MSIKVEYSNGVFKPIGQIENVESGQIDAVFSDAELRNLNESLCCLEAWGKPFEFWNNAEDAIYDEEY